jgi:hypothetical protein
MMVGLNGAAVGDEPPRKPEYWTVCSGNQDFCADYKLANNTITVYEKQTRRTLWTFRGWSPFAWVSRDGEYLALSNGNLAPQPYAPDWPVVTFIHRGRVTGTVKLREVAGPEDVEVTVSHLYWGVPMGFGLGGRFAVRTRQGKLLDFTPPR